MKFTIEQIKEVEVAFDKAAGVTLKDVQSFIIAELTKPECRPEAGEVYWCANGINNGYEAYDPNYHIGSSDRLLTLAEHGPDVKAMQDALKRIASAPAPAGCRQFAALVLKDHKIK